MRDRLLRTAASAVALAVIPLVAGAAGMTQVPASATSPAFPVYVAIPRGDGPFPAVVFLHGCEGISGFETVAADRIAARGYVGVAVDALGPQQARGACGGERDDFRAEETGARATLTWLQTQPYVDARRLAVIGFSMGADVVLDLIDPQVPAAAPAGLRAAIAFYPGCAGRDGAVTIPLEIFDGDADTIAPPAPCAAMARAGSAAGKPIAIKTYPGATHGFPIPGPDRTFFGAPIRFDPQAAADSARETEQFLAQHLK